MTTFLVAEDGRFLITEDGRFIIIEQGAGGGPTGGDVTLGELFGLDQSALHTTIGGGAL